MENNQTAARAAKRFLHDRVRTDWAYPNPPPCWSASDEEVRDAQDFRERYYADSESSDVHSQDEAAPYKFDNPDSVADALAHTRHTRAQRHRDRLDEEVQYNVGLKLWLDRRDNWTGAASVRRYGTKTHSPDATDMLDLVPVAPRLLDSNPIRTSISPTTYPDIFQKIVMSSRTPSVPINLADMTKALVQGWKDADEWPPRAALVDPLVGKKRAVAGTTINSQHGGFMDRHPHLEKSVDSVKRIFHLNGNHQLAGPAVADPKVD
ncbi:hypothetical protein GQ44DRAFT_774429 [Phaeosphaeriaceae sp. PMI808]|nr:hypothetical protein GQ44DRAFT_774429 [Phaeosphaeriaceae sp. PMI808]